MDLMFKWEVKDIEIVKIIDNLCYLWDFCRKKFYV